MKTTKRVLALVLSLIIMLSLVPTSAFAAFDYAHNEAESSDDYYDIISKKDWDIAPGITETEIVLNNEAGDRRQVVHMMVADMSNPYARVISSYTNMDTSKYAISTIPEHAAYIENNWGENVVGAMNTCLSWYNTATYVQEPHRVNEPLGFMMVDGDVYFDHSVGFPTCIVIHKDTNENGETRPSDIPKVEMRTVTDSTCLNGWEDQVIPCSSGYIVKDGVNQYNASHGTDTAARSVVGVKAEGSIVIMMNDGRQAPYSLGMNMYECAEVMIAAGCVYAANCDGGGSSTFMSQRPGEDLNVNCAPCDGSLRQNTHGIIFISTAPATGEFDNAFLSTENDYFVPTSVVEVQAVGRDFSGAEAEIPAEAVWTLADDSFGTVENGVFTSNGKTGNVTIQLVYNEEVVGSKTIHIVNPESVSFAQSSTVIPYGKSVALDIRATYGEFDVVYSAKDFELVVSDPEAGTIEGLTFNATNNHEKTGVKVSATYKHADKGTITLDIAFGKGSEILYDFEDGDISEWLGKDAVVEWAKENNPNSPVLDADPYAGNFSPSSDTDTFLATAANGKVKNGQYALGVDVDYTHSGAFGQWSYNMFFNVGGQKVLRDTANGMNATRLGMWIYIPEELAPGHNLAMQTELYCGTSSTNYSRKNTHLVLECNGKTLTKCSEADIPEDRWVYCYMDLSAYNYVAIQNAFESNKDRREPQFIRFYTQAKEPFKGVLYIDDITLDYSDAVDDRNAPVISNLTVNTSGTTLRSFNATVADHVANNASGLNYASAKIYVDGVALSGVTASGSAMSAPDLAFAPGKHTVTFEISDNMGNTTKESTTFTIAGTAPLTVAGHNDKNQTPEYDSVYYVDIDVADVATIEKVTMDVQLNHANKWELDHMVVAEGFQASYTFNKNHNIATITVEKNGDVDTTATTLVSIPVRVWSWNAEAAGYEASKIGANSYPLVIIKANVCKGGVTFADGEKGSFSGSINVATTMTTSVTPDKWHAHTAAAIDDQEATCTASGYTGRTYCEGCGSVVEWGTTIPAKGHSYKVVDKKLTCDCGATYNETGLINVDGKSYYNIASGLVSGWVEVEGVWYYFDETTYTTVSTLNNGYVTFAFEEDGKLVSGQWYHSSKGSRYYYGPTYYFGRNVGDRWYTIDGKDYCFDINGYCLKGYNFARAYEGPYQWYDFGEDGACKGELDYTGIVKLNGHTYYLKDGKAWYGLYKHDGAYYFCGAGNYFAVVTNITREASVTYCDLPVDIYTFGADGKMVDKAVYCENNVLYYYVLGKKAQGNGTVELNGKTWKVESDGKVLFTGTITDASGQTLDYVDGVYTYIPKNGPHGDYFYVDDVIQKAWKLVEWEGDYYFINDYNKLAKNGKLYLSEGFVNGHTYPNGDPMKPGYYEFDEDGKMIILNGVVNGKYYINGIAQTGWKLFELDGNYYFNEYYNVAQGKQVYLSQVFVEGFTYPNGDPMKPGYYDFDADGKMVILNGVVDGKYYINGIAQTGWKLIEWEGNYYFNEYYNVAQSKRVYLSQVFVEGFTYPNGDPLKVGYYDFDAEGKMILP